MILKVKNSFTTTLAHLNAYTIRLLFKSLFSSVSFPLNKILSFIRDMSNKLKKMFVHLIFNEYFGLTIELDLRLYLKVALIHTCTHERSVASSLKRNTKERIFID